MEMMKWTISDVCVCVCVCVSLEMTNEVMISLMLYAILDAYIN